MYQGEKVQSDVVAAEMPTSIYGIQDAVNEQLKFLFEKVDVVDKKNRLLSGMQTEEVLSKVNSPRMGLIGGGQDILEALRTINRRLSNGLSELESHIG